MTGAHLFDLHGKVALVTGGNGGIGAGIAVGLAEAGADVVIAARNEQKSSAVVDVIEALGHRALAVRCDVLEGSDLEATVGAVRDNFGRLDVLVNNAGVVRRGQAHELSEADWDLVLGTNLKSVFLLTKLAYPFLKADGGGKVINIGSMTSIFGSGRVPAYSTSKGGIVQLTKSMAIPWAKDNIQVNAILPGWIRTEMTSPLLSDESLSQPIIDRTPQGRWGEPEDLAGTAVFLASAASDFVTGQALAVDGGYSVF